MEHFTTGSPFWANSHCTKRTCNGGLWYGGMSQFCWAGSWIPHNFAAAKTRCSALFLFSFWSWSSQGQTWICPCFLENQCGRFPGNLMLSNYICWIGAGKAFLNAFSHGLRQKVEENGNFECKGTKKLGSKLFQQFWVNIHEFNIIIFWSPVCDSHSVA